MRSRTDYGTVVLVTLLVLIIGIASCCQECPKPVTPKVQPARCLFTPPPPLHTKEKPRDCPKGYASCLTPKEALDLFAAVKYGREAWERCGVSGTPPSPP